MKNREQGITLIALIITIIVLLILAGVSISQLLGDNGIITKTVDASEATKSATAKEDVELAWSSVTAGYYEALYKNKTSVDKKTYFSEDAINNELNSGKISNYSGYVEKGKVTFTYTLNSTNDVYEMSLNTGSSSNNVKIVSCNGVAVGTDNPGETEDKYLVDIAEIGDYVDIGIDYENYLSSDDSTAFGKTTLTGWRVLSTEGEGSNGSVTLVSAGAPLTYDYWSSGGSYDYESGATKPLNDLYKVLVTETEDEDVNSYFTFSGFENKTYNMIEVFTKEKHIKEGVHALNENELMALCSEITGTSISTMEKLPKNSNDTVDLSTDNLKNIVGEEWNTKWDDLLTIGQSYWLGGDGSKNNTYLWAIWYNGNVVDESKNYHYGVRPVITLEAGGKVSAGDGNSSDNAYKIYY